MITTWLQDHKKKVIDPNLIDQKVASLRKEGRTIATLNGSFDLLHAGHLHIIYEASQLADVLIVALNTDHSIRQYKGQNRPLISLEYRLQLMAALEFIDYLTYFDEVDPRQILEKISPDIHVNGEEYGDNCIEAETIRACGAKLHLVKRIPGLATTEIINRIHETHCHI